MQKLREFLAEEQASHEKSAEPHSAYNMTEEE
jgi:hypothetical protein